MVHFGLKQNSEKEYESRRLEKMKQEYIVEKKV